MMLDFKQGLTALLLNEGMRDDVWDKYMPQLKDKDLEYRYIVASCHFAAATKTHFWRDSLIHSLVTHLGIARNTAAKKIDQLIYDGLIVYKEIETARGPLRKIIPSASAKSSLVKIGNVYAEATQKIIERLEKFGPLDFSSENNFIVSTLSDLEPETEPEEYETDDPNEEQMQQALVRITKYK